jgi:CheY-like chemotaxis protein
VAENIQLLVVEDEPLKMLAAREALDAGGYTIIEAETGSEALAIIDAHGDNLAGIITDIRLGSGPDGWEVARRGRERKPDIPVVYVTGDSAHEWNIHGVPNSSVVQKPHAPAQLTTAISTLLTAADTNRTS